MGDSSSLSAGSDPVDHPINSVKNTIFRFSSNVYKSVNEAEKETVREKHVLGRCWGARKQP